MHRQAKKRFPGAAQSIGRKSIAPSEPSTGPGLKEEGISHEPPIGVPTELGRDQTAVEYQLRAPSQSKNSFADLISEQLLPEPSQEEKRKKEEELEEYGWSRIKKQIRINLAIEEVKQLTSIVDRQREEIKKLQGSDANKSSMLSVLIHAVKSSRRNKGLIVSEQHVAAGVDGLVKKQNLELRHVAPKNWRKWSDLPRTLVACLNHCDPKLRQVAKSLISRA